MRDNHQHGSEKASSQGFQVRPDNLSNQNIRRCLSTGPPPPSPSSHRAVIFDMGGVILPSPFSAAYRWEADHGYSKGTVFAAIKQDPRQGAWARLERGELALEEFYKPFADEAAALHQDPSITGELVKDFMANLARSLATPDEDMLDAIASLKAQGLKVALLTNNWKSKREGRLLFDGLEMFDEVRLSKAIDHCSLGDRIVHGGDEEARAGDLPAHPGQTRGGRLPGSFP